MKTWYLLWITLHALFVDAQIPAVESITIASDVSTARECVSWCVAENSVQCSVNSCYCAPYIRSSLNSHVSGCVTQQACPDSSDVEAATSAISSYCDKYYAAVGATPSAVPTTAIQDTSTNAIPGATPTSDPFATATSAPSATATSSPGGIGINSPISITTKIVGIVVGGVVTLVALVLFIWATYKSWDEKQKWKRLQYRRPGQDVAPPKFTSTKKWSLGAQIASAVLGLGALIVTIYFGIKPRSPS